MREVKFQDLQMNPNTLIANDWMLVTAGNEERGYNTMTASWGHLGSIWGHNGGLPTALAYLRPQRYTDEFMNREEYFTLTFFDQKYKKALGYLGTRSGRDEDKVAKVGLTPVFDQEYGTTYFAEAKLTLICRKLYRGRLTEEGFTDPSFVEEYYPHRDFHYVYYGQIVKTLVCDEE